MNTNRHVDWSITKLQLLLFLFVIQSGATFINLQFRVINASGQHAWIVFLLVCLFHLGIYILYIRAGQHFHPSKFEHLLFKMYWTFLSIVFLAKIVFISRLWVFQETPEWLILIMIGIVILYALTTHASVSLNLSVLLIPFFVILFGTLFLSWKELVWLNLLPLSELTLKEVGMGSFQSLSAFSGMEALLFLQKNLDSKEKLNVKSVVIFTAIYTFCLTTSILFTLLFFTLEEIKVVPFALMYLLKSQEVTFIERIDLIFIYLWISWGIVSVILYGFLILRTEKSKQPTFKKLFFAVVLVLLISSQFITRFEVRVLHDWMLYLSLVFSLILPVWIMLRSRWFKK